MIATTTAREAFLAVLFNGPIYPADAIVVLSGDGYSRLPTAIELMRQQATFMAHQAAEQGESVADIELTVVVSGGLHEPPYAVDAEHLLGALIERGIRPSWVRLEPDSLNTYDQAEAITRMARDEGWQRILLVTSAYHMPRAFLTFLASMQRAGLTDTLHLCASPVSQDWWAKPAGLDVTRLDLLGVEAGKIERYGEHVASYEDGLAYLESWEGR